MDIKVSKATDEQIYTAKDWPTWFKEKSEFDWSYDDKEQCYIIKGKAKVVFDGGEVEFGVGDYVVFPKGLDCKWIIEEDIEKHYKFG